MIILNLFVALKLQEFNYRNEIHIQSLYITENYYYQAILIKRLNVA